MGKMAVGGAMGFMLGAGMMMTPAGRSMRREMRRTACMMKRWLRSM